MKKLLLVLAAFVLVLTLSACGGGGNDLVCDPGYHEDNGSCVKDDEPLQCDTGYREENGACVKDDTQVNEGAPVFDGVGNVEIALGTAFDLMEGVSATDDQDGDLTADIEYSGFFDAAVIGVYVITYVVTDSDGDTTQVEREISVTSETGCPAHHELVDGVCTKIPAQTITIMHGAVYEIDPFHEAFSGTEQLARQELQRQVEAQYNVVINYENYPASAAWGPSRVSAIIQANVAGEPMSDIYWITSDWLQDLVQGNALADISQYLNTTGTNIPVEYQDVGEYKGGIYGFESYKPTINYGLYYNADLIESLGITNPTELYNDGLWNWSNFEAWVTAVQTALDGETDEMYAMGGMPSYYATAMTTLNDGSLINKQTGRVAFSQKPALDTYDYLTNLWGKGVWEPEPQYDSGSLLWQTGKVALHPGSLWFLTADNRWGTLEFEMGFVPYPVADDYDGEYISPISGVAVMSVASGMSDEREQLVFSVWNALQLWKTKEETDDAFELTLITKFDKQLYIDAYLDVYDKTYLDILNAIGVSAYGENGWARNINIAIRDGSSRTAMDRIKPVYETALDDYLAD